MVKQKITNQKAITQLARLVFSQNKNLKALTLIGISKISKKYDSRYSPTTGITIYRNQVKGIKLVKGI